MKYFVRPTKYNSFSVQNRTKAEQILYKVDKMLNYFFLVSPILLLFLSFILVLGLGAYDKNVNLDPVLILSVRVLNSLLCL